MAGRKVSRNRDNRRVILLVLLVVLVLAVCALSEGYRLYRRNQEYLVIRDELNLKIAAEQARTEELNAYKEYTQTDEFIEWYAKERLGLVKENEIIFKCE